MQDDRSEFLDYLVNRDACDGDDPGTESLKVFRSGRGNEDNVIQPAHWNGKVSVSWHLTQIKVGVSVSRNGD